MGCPKPKGWGQKFPFSPEVCPEQWHYFYMSKNLKLNVKCVLKNRAAEELIPIMDKQPLWRNNEQTAALTCLTMHYIGLLHFCSYRNNETLFMTDWRREWYYCLKPIDPFLVYTLLVDIAHAQLIGRKFDLE